MEWKSLRTQQIMFTLFNGFYDGQHEHRRFITTQKIFILHPYISQALAGRAMSTVINLRAMMNFIFLSLPLILPRPHGVHSWMYHVVYFEF